MGVKFPHFLGDYMSLKVRDFHCRECKYIFEKFTKEIHNVECPKCGSANTEYQIGGVSFKVTGLGTHSTKMKV